MLGKQLRIVNVIHHLSRGGGVALQSVNMAESLRNLGHKVAFVTTETGVADPTTDFLHEETPVTSVSKMAGANVLVPFLLSRALSRRIYEHGCDVIQSFDPLVAALAMLLEKDAQRTIPCVIRLGTNYQAHFKFQFAQHTTGTTLDFIRNATRRSVYLSALSVVERMTLTMSDAVVANCQYLREAYERRFPKLKNITVIPNGVDIQKFNPTGVKRFLMSDRIWLLYVGRIENRKGIDILLRAMPAILKRYPNARLLLVGRAPRPYYLQKLKSLAQNLSLESKIQFIGVVSNEDIPHLMRAVDVLVFPSTTRNDEVEGLPNVILEGMASGLPVVATSICGVPEVINNEYNGLLVRPGSSDEMASSVATLIDSPSMRSELGERAREYVVRNNSMEVTARRYLTLYQMLIRGGR